MTKRQLQNKFSSALVTKGYFKPYQYILKMKDVQYHLKQLDVTKGTILSINSKHIWEIRKGIVDGIRFKTKTSTFLDMREYNKLPNKVILFKEKPFKILKYINESEVIDISNTNEIFDIKICNSIKEMKV